VGRKTREGGRRREFERRGKSKPPEGPSGREEESRREESRREESRREESRREEKRV